ncbi:VRR-NUC domain-containing protein [Salipaludibacillus agaradhaerens]|jgi:hypothetical protein|uniref:VRR-NUC domain-containing protein n=1 Tax=Salipaludibacillus agaradhaerens TaxID=76935 RepID=UPI002151B62D|nr:VRR-NUC domain-containing protein [Salipaludibacillus agaradhaerens]MCR6108592.1 VRR-NUC domain-containing protein [Salipaludibacillus agaradhaerens]MCR6120621.1 VRR-NUC domain-containing protein [Salipaludibacillus agaradhaerens]
MSKTPLESKIETYLKDQIKGIGGLCYKFKSAVNGVPDQIVIYNKAIHLVEVKRPGERPRANQEHIHAQIAKQGVTVYTVDTTNAVDVFIKTVLGAKQKSKSRSKQKGVVMQSITQFKHIDE